MLRVTSEPAKASPSSRGQIRYDALVAVVFYHFVALLALLPYFFTWAGVIVGVVGAYVTASGIGIGYHRLLAHRSFTCSKRVEHVFAVGSSLRTAGSRVLGSDSPPPSSFCG